MPAYDYLRKPPLGCARVPTRIQFEEGRCVVLDSCGGRAAREESRRLRLGLQPSLAFIIK